VDRLHPTLDGGSHIARERSENVYKFRVYALIKLNAGRIPIVAVLNEAWQQQQQRQHVTIAVTQRRRLMRRSAGAEPTAPPSCDYSAQLTGTCWNQ